MGSSQSRQLMQICRGLCRFNNPRADDFAESPIEAKKKQKDASKGSASKLQQSAKKYVRVHACAVHVFFLSCKANHF